MGFNFFPQAAKFLQEQKKHKHRMAIFLCLAVVVALGTVAALKMYGQAMTHKVRVLNCQMEVHEHTEECYAEDADGNKELICGMADYVVHVHNADCYDMNGDLVCPIEEREPHVHDDSCYEEREVLVCGQEETEGTEGHTHTEECYEGGEGKLSCTLEEHEHTDNCYTEELVCELEEHEHDDNCYDEAGELTCEKEEHKHTEGCYAKKLTCGLEEHTHTENCYEERGELICGLEEQEAAYPYGRVLQDGKSPDLRRTGAAHSRTGFDRRRRLL